MDDFRSLGLSDSIAGAFEGLGFTSPTEVQAKAIPDLLAGRDLLMESETGTGKTIAYLAPILEAAVSGTKAKGALALVAAPTQELAVQIGRVAEKLLGAVGLKAEVAVLLGGAPLARQEAVLKRGPLIIVGTIGRLADLAFARILKFGALRFLVLDEADRLFAKETEELCGRLLSAAPRGTQRVMASATLPPRVREIASPWLRNPSIVEGSSTSVLSGDIEHWCFYCDSRKRLDFLRRFEAAERPKRCLLFHSNAARLGKLLETLHGLGLPAEAISARRDKEERRVALERFARGDIRYLLTSDLGARGLDIEGISHVISLDLPEEPTVYVHRAGRTGRAGAKGISIVLADGVELKRASKFALRGGFVFRTKILREGQILEPPVEEFFAFVEESEQQRERARRGNGESASRRPSPASAGKGRSPRVEGEGRRPREAGPEHSRSRRPAEQDRPRARRDSGEGRGQRKKG